MDRINFAAKLAEAARRIDLAVQQQIEKAVEEVALDPIDQSPLQVITDERWSVYRFTLPPAETKVVATGFESKEVAKLFIEERLKQKEMEIEREDGSKIFVKYDVIRESRGNVDIYFNEPEITTVGNERDVVLERWVD